jgi:hypothetical protein
MKIKKEGEHTKYMHVPAGDVFNFTTGAHRETYIKTAAAAAARPVVSP